MMSTIMRPRIILSVLACLSALVFFYRVDSLWPLAPGEHVSDSSALRAVAVPLLSAAGIDVGTWEYASRLRVDDQGLRYLEKTCGQQRCVAYIRQGLPLYFHRLTFKQAGNPQSVTCLLDGFQRLLGFEHLWEDDDAAPLLTAPFFTAPLLVAQEVDARALRAIATHLHLDPARCMAIDIRTQHLPQRVEYSLTYAYVHDDDSTHREEPLVEERIEVVFAGTQLRKIWRSLKVPASFVRQQRSHSGGGDLLESLGFAGLAIISTCAIVLLLLILKRHRAGEDPPLPLIPALLLIAVVAVMLLVNNVLQYAVLFEYWDPLTSYSLTSIRRLLFELIHNAMTLVPLLACIIVASYYDHNIGRCHSFWLACRGRWAAPSVRAASYNGFAIGLCCGAALLLSAWFFQTVFHGYNELQPRGFFFYTLNSSASLITCICFFGYIALMEEFAYRIFAGAWIDKKWGARWLAILIPASIYGCCHANFTFLPPADPWWARALCMTIIGIIWGWAFFHYDALTVICSHFAADVFIFNWPLIASGNPSAVLWAVLSVSLPLWIGIIGSLYASIHRQRKTA